MILKSILLAFGICLINAMAAFISALIALKKEQPKFNKIIFGSMVIRYFLVSAAVLLTLLFVEINKLGFGLTFLISTFVLIFAEILYLNYRSNFLNLQNKISKKG